MTLAFVGIVGGAAYFTVTGDGKGTALNGVPAITEEGGPGVAVSAVYALGSLLVTFDFAPDAATRYVVPQNDPALRNAQGGFLASQVIGAVWQDEPVNIWTGANPTLALGCNVLTLGSSGANAFLPEPALLGSQVFVVADPTALANTSVKNSGFALVANVNPGEAWRFQKGPSGWEALQAV